MDQKNENTPISNDKNDSTMDTSTKETTIHHRDDSKQININKEINENKRMKEEKQKTPWQFYANHHAWDYILAGWLLLSSGFLFYRFTSLAIFSFDWMWKIAVLLAVVNLVLFLLLFIRKFPIWAMWVRRCFLLILCCCVTYGTIFASTLQTTLEAITQPETATTINVSLITKKDGGAKHLEDLSGKKIGIQNANDSINSSYVKEQLTKENDLKQVTYVEEIDYDSLYQKLMSGEIDALIITDYYFKTLLKESYPTIEEDIFILKSYQKAKESALNTTTKDIRYEPFTVYLAGVDEGDDPSIDARSDVNIVLIVNPLANHIEMVSIPRDSFVPNPALNYGNDKLTHLGLNGITNSMEGIEEVFGFEIDFYVKLNFFSVIDIIDAIGEIEVDVPVSFCEQDEYRSFAEEDLICLNEGVQKVNGKQALAFARHRKSYTDVMRGKAQQEVIKGIINVITTPSGVANINNVLKIASKTVSTNMPMEQVTNFVSAQLDHLKPWTIDSIVLENGADAYLVAASMPGQELSVMLLNRLDVQQAYDAYQEMLNQMQFSSFTFHLDELEQSKQEIPYNSKVVWAGSNVGKYQLNQPSNEPENPVTPPTNTAPQEPTKEEPTPPATNGSENPGGNTEKPNEGSDDPNQGGNNNTNNGTPNGGTTTPPDNTGKPPVDQNNGNNSGTQTPPSDNQQGAGSNGNQGNNQSSTTPSTSETKK